MIDPVAATVPGFTESVAALKASEYGNWLDTDEIGEVAAFVMGVARPYVQAELLADVSDYLTEIGQDSLADLLDNISYGVRKAVYGE